MGLLEKLLEIKKAMPYFKKENVNKGMGFSYVSSSQVLSIFREKSDELDIMVIPRITDYEVEQKGKQLLTQLKIIYRIIDVANPEEFIEIPFYAQGMDVGEKGVGKALTYGEKYMLLKLFNVPTDKDDPDASMLATKVGVPPKEEAETGRFEAAMNKIRTKFNERDGNDNAVGMMLRLLGFERDSEITATEDRKKVVNTLLKELGVEKVSNL